MSAIESVRDRVGEELFRLVAGPDGQRRREFVHGSPGPRWFDPDSPIGRVHGDASMFVGGIRAIMLQSLHPAAMQGVAEHSGYRGDMWGRLAQIANFIAITTFGTERHAEQAIAAVRRAHESVTGTMPDGTPYEANDPHLLGWVHAAEVESFLLAHEVHGHRPLTAAEQDAYVEQTARVARRLGVTEPPTSRASLDATLATYRPELAGTDHARDAIRFLIREPDLPLAARPPYLSLVGAAVALMPAWTRAELALAPPRRITDRTATAVGGGATRLVRWAMSPGHAHARRLQQAAGS
ncbi:oxygenase MpaB family protein [Nocardioides seonyuensis]|uniref:oxygenase MpaB family protein n=1 Tax=Nocardioides seonyuensis TaxID=2518371 RepID=UPI001FC9223D|nr:oxygenase MpaB family protein [Nocardioides seonyuensis]